MNDDTLLSRLAPVTDEQAAAMVSRHALGALADEIIGSASGWPPAAGSVPVADEGASHGRRYARPVNRARRRLAWAAASALAAAAVVGVGVIASGGQPASGGKTAENGTPGSSGKTAASGSSRRPAPAASTTLTAWTVTENGDGTLTVTIREMKDPSGLQATLRADGARVVVTASLAWPAGCSEWRGGNFTMGSQVLQNENRTGLPSANGTEFFIRPSDIPAGAMLWLGLSQTGKPKGVVGPPGPIGSGYLTASAACARS